MNCNRREFVRGLTVAGTAGLFGLRPKPARAEPPPETTKLRVSRSVSICQAPQYIAEPLFAAEGFTDVQYVGEPARPELSLVSGEAHIGMVFVGPLLLRLDEGAATVILAGGHVGCIEVFAHEPIRAIRGLKGKKLAVAALGNPTHTFLATVMSYVGLDPSNDATIVVQPPREALRAFAEKRLDAWAATPPFAQELRSKRVGHVIVNSAVDRPWSQYFCCMIAAHRPFVEKHPVATKRAVRAILKSADLCAMEPERAARLLVDKGFTQQYDYAVQTMKELPYGRWREYDPEDTVRFYALRLHEVGMIKANPQKLIAQGTDWRFFNELKKELKG